MDGVMALTAVRLVKLCLEGAEVMPPLNEGMADVLAKKYGILQREKAKPDHQVCTIGWSDRKQKWYGWSHRAIYGYGVGDRSFPKCPEGPESVHWDPPPKEKRPIIKTLDQAKQSAKNFADWVG